MSVKAIRYGPIRSIICVGQLERICERNNREMKKAVFFLPVVENNVGQPQLAGRYAKYTKEIVVSRVPVDTLVNPTLQVHIMVGVTRSSVVAEIADRTVYDDTVYLWIIVSEIDVITINIYLFMVSN